MNQDLSHPEVDAMLCTSTLNCGSGEMSIQVVISGVDKSAYPCLGVPLQRILLNYLAELETLYKQTF